MLLIVAGLDEARLAALLRETQRFGMEALVEVHDEYELTQAVGAGATLIGINNRDLRTFETDLGVTEHLLPSVPAGLHVISESGVHDPADTARLYARRRPRLPRRRVDDARGRSGGAGARPQERGSARRGLTPRNHAA